MTPGGLRIIVVKITSKMKILRRILTFIACMAVIAVVSVRRDHRLLGYELENKATTAPTDTLTMAGDTLVVHTAMLAQDVQGYAGTTPLDIYVLDNVVVKIVALPNVESPDFFGEAVGLLDAYKGKTVDEALSAKVDGVSGATFSSQSLISNVRRGVVYASAHNASAADGALSWSLKTIVALLVIVLGMTVPLVVRNKKMRLVQLVLDIVVLGLWTGTFVSYTMLVNLMSNGLTSWSLVVPMLLVVAAFVYPLFGRRAYYCTHLCPLGAAQELVFKVPARKLTLSKKAAHRLTLFKVVLWSVLMLLMLLGVGFEWMDYEPFTAFVLSSAGVVVIVFAVVILLTSVFVPRPYCRFMCPTGTLLKQK